MARRANKNPKDDDQKRLLEDIQTWAKHTSGNLSRLLYDFEVFSREYFTYFEQEVIDKGVCEEQGATPEYVRYQALSTIANEWSILSRVAEQRELGTYRDWLDGLDQSTNDQYHPPKTDIPMLAYLGRACAIRHNPYSSVTVCSIPRYQYGNEHEALMAYAHEVGHKVFWSLQDAKILSNEHEELSASVRKICVEMADKYALTLGQFQYLHELIDSWLEEMFADVYGTLVAGLPFADSIAKILKNRTCKPDHLFVDDGDHPFPYLRPLLRLEVLELILWEKNFWQEILRDDFVFPTAQEIFAIRAVWEQFVWKTIGKSQELKTTSFMINKQSLIYLKSQEIPFEVIEKLKDLKDHNFKKPAEFEEELREIVKQAGRLKDEQIEKYIALIKKGALQIGTGQLPCVFVEIVLSKVVNEVLPPLAKNVHKEGIPLPDFKETTAFERYKGKIEKQALKQSIMPCKLLLLSSISTSGGYYGYYGYCSPRTITACDECGCYRTDICICS